MPETKNVELVLLRVHVIARENLLTAVPVEGSDRQRRTNGEMADVISPRSGSTQHTLMIRATRQKADLVDRAVHVPMAQP